MFSVVIPLYNKELSIRNTILSVLNQSYQDFEIIVINDGSTDNSVEVINNIQDNRIRVIHQENKGVSLARNHGITQAKYEWVAFLDGDDLWENNHLEEIMNMMEIYPDEKVFVTSFEYSDKRKIFKHDRNSRIFIIDNYFKEAIDETLIWTSIIVLNKECIAKVKGFNPILKRGEDMDLWVRVSKNYNIVKSAKITAIYRIDAENRTNLSKELKSTHVYYFDFSNTISEYEFIYYQEVLFQRLFSYLKSFYILCFIKLLLRHKEINFFDFLIFAFNIVKHKIFHQKIKNF